MIHLIIIDSSGRERKVEIGAQPKVFGRAEDCDCVLGSRSVALHHVKLWLQGDRVQGEDLSEGQGALLQDGKPVNKKFDLLIGAELQVGGFRFCLRDDSVQPPEASALGSAGAPCFEPLLEGVSRPIQDLEIVLQQGDNPIGRDPSSYLVIEDSSVSRQQALLTVKQGDFLLRDLHSSNGTLVNGKAIDSTLLRSGDRVRFGDLEFRFLYGPPVAQGGRGKKARRLLLVASVSLLLACVGLWVYFKSLEPSVLPLDAGGTGPQIKPEILAEKRLNTARQQMELLNWEAADREVDQALELYPISKVARDLRRVILQEKQNKVLFDEANTNYDLNKEAEALTGYRRIPSQSVYAGKCKYKIQDLEKRLSDIYLKEGASYLKANQFENAHKNFSAYLELKPCDRLVYDRQVKRCEDLMRRYGIRFTPLAYRCLSEGISANGANGSGVDVAAALQAAYPQEPLQEAVRAYHLGKVEQALGLLRKLQSGAADPKLAPKAKQLQRALMIISGKFNEGTASLLRGEVEAAREQFTQALDYDAKVMPKGLRSFYQEEIGRQLAAKLRGLGREEFDRKQWVKAFGSWMDCLKFKPDDIECMSSLGELEKVAEEALAAAEGYEEKKNPKAMELWNLVLRFTRQESLPYKSAQLKLEQYQQDKPAP